MEAAEAKAAEAAAAEAQAAATQARVAEPKAKDDCRRPRWRGSSLRCCIRHTQMVGWALICSSVGPPRVTHRQAMVRLGDGEVGLLCCVRGTALLEGFFSVACLASILAWFAERGWAACECEDRALGEAGLSRSPDLLMEDQVTSKFARSTLPMYNVSLVLNSNTSVL